MSSWDFDYALNQARLVLKDNGKLHSHGFVCDMLEPIINRLDKLTKERENNPGVWNYRRTLPKTKAREIAEKWGNDFSNKEYITRIIESAILESQGNPS